MLSNRCATLVSTDEEQHEHVSATLAHLVRFFRRSLEGDVSALEDSGRSFSDQLSLEGFAVAFAALCRGWRLASIPMVGSAELEKS